MLAGHPPAGTALVVDTFNLTWRSMAWRSSYALRSGACRSFSSLTVYDAASIPDRYAGIPRCEIAGSTSRRVARALFALSGPAGDTLSRGPGRRTPLRPAAWPDGGDETAYEEEMPGLSRAHPEMPTWAFRRREKGCPPQPRTGHRPRLPAPLAPRPTPARHGARVRLRNAARGRAVRRDARGLWALPFLVLAASYPRFRLVSPRSSDLLPSGWHMTSDRDRLGCLPGQIPPWPSSTPWAASLMAIALAVALIQSPSSCPWRSP